MSINSGIQRKCKANERVPNVLWSYKSYSFILQKYGFFMF